MHKKKILHITQALGGVKTYFEYVIKYSNQIDFEYLIIAPYHRDFEIFCKNNSIVYYGLDLQRNISGIRDFAVWMKIISLIRKEKPNVIHAHSAKGGFLGRLAAKATGSKVIYTPHAFSYLPFTGIKRTIFYSLEYIAKRWTDLLLAVSHSEANRAYFELGFKKSKVSVVLNSIALPTVELEKNYSNNFRIGMIGRLTYQKNPLLYLEIADTLLKQYPFLKFSILGSGLHDHLNKEINEFLVANNLINKIEIIQWGNSSTSSNYLNNTDIFVMTSAFEGLPFSLLEAMAKGIPCVVSKADGNSDVIQNGENGYACLSADDFCEKLELLIKNETLRETIGKAGYEYVKKWHDIKTNIKQLEKIYSSF